MLGPALQSMAQIDRYLAPRLRQRTGPDQPQRQPGGDQRIIADKPLHSGVKPGVTGRNDCTILPE